MKNYLKLTLLALFATAFAFTSCDKDDETTTAPAEPTLYERLGGAEMVDDPANQGQMIEAGRLALRGVVDSSIFVIAGDTALQPYFGTLLGEVGSGDLSGFSALSKNLTDFFAAAAGSENFTYSGLNMVDAHDPSKNSRMAMAADDAAFDAFIADVVVGANQNNVPDDILGEVGALIESLRGDVVQK